MNLAECPACGDTMKYIHEHDECWNCGLVIGCCEGTTIGVRRVDERAATEMSDVPDASEGG